MTSPFLVPLPRKIADDPELAPYFNQLNKTLHDLTTKQLDAIDSPTADVTSLKTAVDGLISANQTHGLTK